ncbi:carbohydrate ABC transporter permease [Cohnella silvisoli]|uniref:Carbohydrate ABC transporter permease n=1 Tax=Cohnella silvisoli TaxID=2873699 RepID=A0ABV1L0I3_9BACL|nr:carbohydrate ABC transporter permease [Cohnella silvisoli]MCD9025144.1 carbohydrate ABC transporter permease [Cohnella silvisoli]
MKFSYKMILYAILTAWAIAAMMPIYWMVVTAFTPQSLLMEIQLFPKSIVFNNFETLFAKAPIDRWLFNSLLVSALITLGAVVSDSMAGYSYAMIKPKGHMVIFFLVLACLMIPDQIRIVPLFIMIKNLGWYNTYAALIVPFMSSVFGMFLMRQYMSSLPRELMDAARVEGCNEFVFYTRIVVPLCKPVFAVVAIFFFVGTWNSFLYPLILTSSKEMRTLPVGLSTLMENYSLVDYGLMMAGSSISAIPVILFFFMFQKYFTKGVTLGAVKE